METILSPARVRTLARWNAVLLTRNRLALFYGVVLPLAPLLLLLTGDDAGVGAASIVTTMTFAALFPVFYNVLAQFVSRRDELVLKRLRSGEARDAEILVALALPGYAILVLVAVLAIPLAIAAGQPVPLNPLVYLVAVLLVGVLFTAFAFWTAAWTRNAEAAQLTSMPVVFLAVMGQMSVAFPDRVRDVVDLTPGAALTDLIRTSWFGLGEPGTERTLDFADTWAAAAQPLLVLVVWIGLAGWLASRSMRWEPRT